MVGCSGCGAAVARGDAFCSYCGVSVAHVGAGTASVGEPDSSGQDGSAAGAAGAYPTPATPMGTSWWVRWRNSMQQSQSGAVAFRNPSTGRTRSLKLAWLFTLLFAPLYFAFYHQNWMGALYYLVYFFALAISIPYAGPLGIVGVVFGVLLAKPFLVEFYTKRQWVPVA